MASVFWDAHGIFFIAYLEKGKTINSDYYMRLMNRLSSESRKNALTCKRKNLPALRAHSHGAPRAQV